MDLLGLARVARRPTVQPHSFALARNMTTKELEEIGCLMTFDIARGRTKALFERREQELLHATLRVNDVEALSMLLSLNIPGTCEYVEARAIDLIKRTMESDAAECCLYLLNLFEERRRKRQLDAEEEAEAGLTSEDEKRKAKYQRIMERNERKDAREKELVQQGQPMSASAKTTNHEQKEEYCMERERHCTPAPNARALLSLAREALEVVTPRAPRCGRALLLHAHRLRKSVPKVGQRLLGTDDQPLRDDTNEVGVPWPSTPTDLPAELLDPGGVGGLDLSLGGEAVPLQWVNEVDAAVPPPIVFVRRCIDVDVHPDWRLKGCKACSSAQVEQCVHDRCATVGFQGKPDGVDAECNWRCNLQSSCEPHCSRRQLQRGACHRLQVFRDKMKGWCLRTLTPIKKDSFVMEYVAERISPFRADERKRDMPDVETYIMDMDLPGARGFMHLDALGVRNHAAFASFACSKKFANIRKKALLTNHWDSRVPHVGFFATRDIEALEELCYLRTDEQPKSTSTRNCNCCRSGCSGWL